MPLLFGTPIAERILAQAKQTIEQAELQPGLAVILVGDDPGSTLYVRLKEKAALSIGIRYRLYQFTGIPEDMTEVMSLIRTLNRDPLVHGVLLQLPLPNGWDADHLIALIDPAKDADGFHQTTLKDYLSGDDTLIPVLPRAIRELLQATGVMLSGASAVALVNSTFFGTIIEHLLRTLGLTVHVIDRQNVSQEQAAIRQAKVIVSVVGEPGLIDLETVRKDAIVIDAGITRVGETICGDIAGDKQAYAGWVTPLPGGVGPVTIACLLDRVTDRAQRAVRVTQSPLR